jgi:hypothetical protein
VPEIIGKTVFVGPAASAAFGASNVVSSTETAASDAQRVIRRNFISSLSLFSSKN